MGNNLIYGNAGVPGHLALHSGEPCVIVIPEVKVIVDAHMHIQSLNCTPLPLQWGTLYLNTQGIGTILWGIGTSRQDMTRTAAGRNVLGALAALLVTGDLGRVGQYSTDLIASIFMGKAKNSDFAARLHWLLDNKKLAEELAQNDTEESRAAAGDEIKLSALNDKKDAELRTFEETTKDYYRCGVPLRMNLTMPMDLSYAHFWGLHDLPIYLPVLGGNTFYFINDFYSIVDGHISFNYKPLGVFSQGALKYDIDLREPIASYYQGGDTTPRMTFGASDRSKKDSTEQAEYEAKNRKPYKHFLMEIPETRQHGTRVPGDSTEMFEDYWEQAALHEASVLRYPVNIIPFFHYDPRRYYEPIINDPELHLPRDAQEVILENIANRHSFFTVKQETARDRQDWEKTVEVARVTLHNFWGTSPRDYFKQLLFEGLGATTGYEQATKKTAPPAKKLHGACVAEYLYPAGPFLGVKVYPPLGYPGDLFSSDQAKRFGYPPGRYESLRKLFLHCVQHGLPVTSHSSPLGMSISDGHNYLINDKRRALSVPPSELTPYPQALREGTHNFRDCALYVDDIASHPSNWKRVLDTPGLSSLKLCLAHFSGMDVWTTLGYPPNLNKLGWFANKRDWTRRDWREEVIGLIDGYSNVYTDISCYTVKAGKLPSFTERGYQEVLSRCGAAEREIVERAYFKDYEGDEYIPYPSKAEEPKVRSILRSQKIIEDDVYTLAQGLAEAIKRHPKLKWRVLMGSDWYMAEMGKTGVGGYYTKIFETLALVTHLVGEGWDAWHQFAVVNPLIYLGLIETPPSSPSTAAQPELKTDSKSGLTYYDLKTDRIERAYEKARAKVTSTDWIQLSHFEKIEEKRGKIFAEYTTNLNKLKASRIYSSDSMKRDGELLIRRYPERMG